MWVSGALAVAAVFVQLVLGAIYRHGGPTLWYHAVWAGPVAIAVGSAMAGGLWRFPAEPATSWLATLITLLLFTQLGLGVWALIMKHSALPALNFWRVIVPTAHVVTGAALLGSLSVWTLRTYRLK
jgi:heme A synthase